MQLLITLNEQELQKIFRHYDENGNGQMDYKEFAAVFAGSDSSKANKSVKSYGSY